MFFLHVNASAHEVQKWVSDPGVGVPGDYKRLTLVSETELQSSAGVANAFNHSAIPPDSSNDSFKKYIVTSFSFC